MNKVRKIRVSLELVKTLDFYEDLWYNSKDGKR